MSAPKKGRQPHTQLSWLFRSKTQERLLAALYLSPREVTISALAKLAGVSQSGAVREVAKLHAAGVITVREEGASKYVSARTDTRVHQLVRELVLMTYGPKPALERALSGVDGVDEAFIYGSWAKRYHGVSGPPPNDIDVLVVGTPSRDVVYDVADEVGSELRSEINVAFLRPEDWVADASGFVTEIKASPGPVPLELERHMV